MRKPLRLFTSVLLPTLCLLAPAAWPQDESPGGLPGRAPSPPKVGVATASATQSDVYVIESTVPALKVGAKLSVNDKIVVPDGSFVRVVLPSGKTQTIRGPYSGTVADMAKGQTPNAGVLAWLRGVLETGGATEATPGATRSMVVQPRKPIPAFSWQVIPVTVDGNVCIDSLAKLQLGRETSQGTGRVTVVEVATSARAVVEWPAGSTTAPWPQAVAPRADAAYVFLQPDRPLRQITLRLLDRLPEEGDVLTELHKRGCKQQFEAWVREKMTANAGQRAR
jgi:hypothetical protein